MGALAFRIIATYEGDIAVTIDNQDIAILSRVNDLAERFGMKPYHITCQVEYNDKSEKTELHFVGADRHMANRVEAMLNSIAGPQGMPLGILAGDVSEIIEALDHAIARAPARRGL